VYGSTPQISFLAESGSNMQRTKLVSNSLLFALVALILCATLALPVSAATLTVGVRGQYTTIQQAVDAAKPGDTVLVAPGTYTENVVVNKPLTITGTATVQAADSSKDVFLLASPGVHIDGLTITGGASGVDVANVSSCLITNINASGNIRALYLADATNTQVRNSNLSNNGYGVYCDYASSNTISNNVATGEKGNGEAAGDGIYMYYGGSNKVSNNDLSANIVFGISLFSSSNNIITGNTMSQNTWYGVRFRQSDNNTFTFNTVRANAQEGICLIETTNHQIYLNNFIDQPAAIIGASQARLYSPQAMAYTYNGTAQTGYMGNYYSDYNGTASNGTGIGSTPSAYSDKYPLMQPVASYGTIVPASAVTTTASSGQPRGQNQTATTTAGQSSTGTGVPGFEGTYTVAGLAIVALALLGKRHRAK
jgi:parallel beta-helix repeat protein